MSVPTPKTNFRTALNSYRAVNTWTVAALAVAWIALWGVHAFKSAYLVLATQVQDDTYYYLLPAWNFSRLGRFTFDGKTSAYGFQPLWELLLTVAASISNSRELFLRLTLFIGALCYAATAVGAGRAASAIWRGVNREPAVVAMAVAAATLLLNTPVQLSNLTGKENALYGVLLVMLLNLHLDERFGEWRGLPVVSGMVAGLILLARLTPMSVAVVIIHPVLIRRVESRAAFTAKYAIALSLTLVPWIAYANMAFGSVLPWSVRLNANAAWAVLMSENRPAPWTLARTVADYVASCARFALGLKSTFWPAPHQYDAVGPILVPFLVLSGTIGAMFASVQNANSDVSTVAPAKYILAVLCAVTAATVIIPIALSTDRLDLYYRRWYVVELPILAAILAGIGAETITHLAKRFTRAIGTTCWIGLLVVWIVMGARDTMSIGKPAAVYRDEGEWQQVTLRAANWSNRELHLTRSDHVGAFSAGLLGWFSNATVINLDGLANDEVARVLLENKSVAHYCIQRQIHFYIDTVEPAEVFDRHRVVATFPNGSVQYPVYYVAEVAGN